MFKEEKNDKNDENLVDKIKTFTDDLAEDIKETVDNHSEVIEDVIEKVEEVSEEIKENFKDKYIKILAEMENLRKRSESERSEILKYRASSFIQNILPTVDMFEMAMSAQNISEEVKNWLVGFEMILNNFKTTLENEGVKEIKTNKGDEFDANLHHAIEEVETNEIESGKILEVKIKGYKIHDKLLRPATVTVAKNKIEKENLKGENNE